VRVVGVDGCPAGWVAVAVDVDTRSWAARVHTTFDDLLAAYPDAAAIGVDIPIGLPAEGKRACDAIARARLGPRRSSVFNAPSRRLLDLIADAPDYQTANRLCRRTLGHGIGAQAYNIFAKIREVDALMTSHLQRRVREVHPELCFTALREAVPCQHPKRTRPGAAERLAAMGLTTPPKPPPGAHADDLLDALAAARTAASIARGEATSFPDQPELDPRGLRMEMVV
jgi:predicted RNase H-like nuclease